MNAAKTEKWSIYKTGTIREYYFLLEVLFLVSPGTVVLVL